MDLPLKILVMAILALIVLFVIAVFILGLGSSSDNLVVKFFEDIMKYLTGFNPIN